MEGMTCMNTTGGNAGVDRREFSVEVMRNDAFEKHYSILEYYFE